MHPLLGISVETSGRNGSVAIGVGERILHEKSFSGPLRHSAELFPTVSGFLTRIGRAARQVQHVYISAGPGSFTGIRIAVTFAKTLSFATQAKIVAVETMALIAENASDFIRAKSAKIDRIATILDAKRGQFFVAVFERQNDQWVRKAGDRLTSADEFVRDYAHKEPIYLLGEGLVYYQDAFKAPGIHIMEEEYWYPYAGKLYHLGRRMAERGKFSDPAGLVRDN